MSPGSIMPSYQWLSENDVNKTVVPDKINAMRTLGVPYPEGYDKVALKDYDMQAQKIVENLRQSGIEVDKDKEIVALIAYLQRLGTDIKLERTQTASVK